MLDTEALTLELSEEEALQRHADSANLALLWRWAGAAGALSILAGLFYFAKQDAWPMLIALAHATALVLLYLKSDSPWVNQRPRAVCLGFLLVETALVALPIWDLPAPARVVILGLGIPLLCLTFSLRPREALLPLLPAWGATVWIWMTDPLLSDPTKLWPSPRGFGGLLWPTLATATLLAAGSNLAQARRRTFLNHWRRSLTLDRERNRIKEELEDARQIQLSMLPRSTPQLGWLDIASVSLPASEVGGDYYDFFLPEPSSEQNAAESSLAIAIGDVAGHGLASGLLLSGLRSCLFLLKRQLPSPAGVLAQLDDMVRQTTDRRLLVTLLLSHLDRASRRLRLASAGHPPPLHFRSSFGQVDEIVAPALPLGTRLSGAYHEVEVDLESGDVVLFFTDGLTETENSRGDAYGDARLRRALVDAVRSSRSARETRSALLSDLTNFKGDARRGDDVTLVVVRVT